MDKKSSDKIYKIKFILAVGIVIYHANLLNTYGYQKNDLSELLLFFDNFADMFGEAGNTLFIFFAAYFMFVKNIEYLQMLKKKVKSLLVPLILWNMFGFIVINHCFVPIGQFIRGMLFSEYDGPLWFCNLLFLLALLYPIIDIISDNKYLLYISIVVLFAIRILLINCPFFIIRRDIYYTIWYLIGAFIARYHNKWLIVEVNNKKRVFCIFLLVLLTLFSGTTDISDLIIALLRPILVWHILNVSNINDSMRLEIFKTSFFVFASHFFLLGMLKKLLNYIDFIPNLYIAIIARYVIGGAVACICALIGLVLNKKAPKIYKIICGR